MIYTKRTALFCVLMIAIGSFSACTKAGIPPINPPVDSILTVTVNQASQGAAIADTFQGLSYEMSILPNAPSFLNPNNSTLIQLIKNLGNGILRIGGNSSDDVLWSNTTRSKSTPSNTLTQSEVNTLSTFSNSIGWKVLFGLNMGEYDTAAAASEATYVYNKLQSNLFALQFGNEPDGYASWNPKRTSPYAFANYLPQWQSYYAAVKSRVPSVPLAGPDVAYQASWVASFASGQKTKVKLLDSHYYQNGQDSATSLGVNALFTPIPQYANYFTTINKAAVAAKLPWRISECNSINGGGFTGVSNVFGAALWALDFMWNVAENNGTGVNFHGGTGGPYSPFVYSNGVTVPQPIYYAFLAFKYGANGSKILPTSLSTTKYKFSAYASVKSGTTYVTLINKSQTQGLTVNLQLTNNASSAQVARLSAPSMVSTSGVSFCGSSVASNGTFQLGSTENYTIGGLKTFMVTVPPASAAVVSIVSGN